MTQAKPKYAPQAATLELEAGRSMLTCLEWCAVIGQLKTLGAERMTLAGPEPLLYPRWRELVDHIRAQGAAAELLSSGSAVTGDDVRFMKKAGVARLGVSLDGDEATHDLFHRKPGAFQRVLELFRLCRGCGLTVIPTTSVNKVNFRALGKMLQTLLAEGAAVWQVQLDQTGKSRCRIRLDLSQYAKLCEQLLLWQGLHHGKIRILAADSIGYCHPLTDAILGGARWQGCKAGTRAVAIRADGTVVGCLSLKDKAFAAGNVREKPLAGIWDDDGAFAYNRRADISHLVGACRACRSASACRAGCLGLAHAVTGAIDHNPYCYRAIVAARRGRAEPPLPA